jgi:DNA modification methylase
MSNVKMFKYEWIWEKEQSSNFMLSKKQIGKIHENILVFYSEQCVYNPQMTVGHKPSTSGSKNKIETSGSSEGGRDCSLRVGSTDRYPTSILKYNRDKNKSSGSFHPTQKPVALGRYLIRTYTNEGDLILDNTCGSGSFLVAAMLEKRKFIGIELDENYCAIARKRLEDTQKEINSKLPID